MKETKLLIESKELSVPLRRLTAAVRDELHAAIIAHNQHVRKTITEKWEDAAYLVLSADEFTLQNTEEYATAIAGKVSKGIEELNKHDLIVALFKIMLDIDKIKIDRHKEYLESPANEEFWKSQPWELLEHFFRHFRNV